jgi:ADP-ribose pyrophosphatase YjhB (NUDIX family)
MKYNWLSFLAEGETKTVGVVVCINENQEFLIIRRSNIDKRVGQWTLPGGHIDDDDSSVEQGAARELKEEVDLVCEQDDLIFLGQPKPDKYYFLAKKWSGNVNIYKPNPKTGDIEHDYYKWATIEDIKDIDNTEIPIYLLEKALDIFKNE